MERGNEKMFQENLKNLRKKKGYSQQELAVRLNVVRQTISKWEKGLSVPDADTLIQMAEVFDVSVNELLGVNVEMKDEESINSITEQLVRINEQLAVKNNRWRKFWKRVGLVLLAILIFWVVITIMGCVLFTAVKDEKREGAKAVEIVIEKTI